jgi:hypothetical protein
VTFTVSPFAVQGSVFRRALEFQRLTDGQRKTMKGER